MRPKTPPRPRMPRRPSRMAELIRVQKALADAGVASRRGADALVAEGRVTVNGDVAVTGQRVDPSIDALAVDGRPVLPAGSRTYLALHKPAGVTRAVSDRHAAQTVLDLVPPDLRAALVRARTPPGGRSPRRSVPMRTRTSRATGAPMAANMRRSWRFQPCVSTAWYQASMACRWPSRRAASTREASRSDTSVARPSSSSTPSVSRWDCSTVSGARRPMAYSRSTP